MTSSWHQIIYNGPYMSLQNSLTEVFSNFRLNYNCCLLTIGINTVAVMQRIQNKALTVLCSFQWFARDAHLFEKCTWRNWKPCIIFANFLLTNRGCSIEIKGVFVRDDELDLHNVHESPKIEHLSFSDMRKGEGQMKVKADLWTTCWLIFRVLLKTVHLSKKQCT